MNRSLLCFLFPLLTITCKGKHQSETQVAQISELASAHFTPPGDTVFLNLQNSRVYWKGTKMRGMGKHEGEVLLKEGYFLAEKNRLTRGYFKVDMQTITVTDIPEHDPIPRRNLTNHLKSADFFEVGKYPTAEFSITRIERLPSDSLQVSGNLTLKSTTRNIQFKAYRHGPVVKSMFLLDRFQWGVGYTGSWADKNLVDKDIQLTISLEIR